MKIVFRYDFNNDVIGYKTDESLFDMMGRHFHDAYCYDIKADRWYRNTNSPMQWDIVNAIEVPKFMRAQALLLI